MALLILVLILAGLTVGRRPVTWDLTGRTLLDILTTLGALTAAVTFWSIGVVAFHLQDRTFFEPIRFAPLAILSSIVLALGLIGVWRRRKWGAWLVLAQLAFTAATQTFTYRALGWDMFRGLTGWVNVTGDVASLVLWVLALLWTWKHFGHSDYGRHAREHSAALQVEDGQELPSI
jgi:hypothetical protein